MRDIKFRIWVPEDDGEPGYMISGDDLAFEEYLPLKDLLSQERIMQFTGLKDKNDKEIYEGDILQVKTLWYKAKRNDEEQEKGTTLWTVEHKIYNTEMGFFTFGIDRRFHKPLTKSRLFNAEAEVIGNIYDNIELLEARDDV